MNTNSNTPKERRRRVHHVVSRSNLTVRTLPSIAFLLFLITSNLKSTTAFSFFNSNNSSSSTTATTTTTTTTTTKTRTASTTSTTTPTTTSSDEKAPKKVISLAESIKISSKSLRDPEVELKRKQYWQKALSEIKVLGAPKPLVEHPKKSFFSQWKQGSNTTTTSSSPYQQTSWTTPRKRVTPKPRFEGFASWERRLQDWADDVQEYLDKVKLDVNNSDYSMSGFGRAMAAISNETAVAMNDVALNMSTAFESFGNDTMRAISKNPNARRRPCRYQYLPN
jgi:hypothetical protein